MAVVSDVSTIGWSRPTVCPGCAYRLAGASGLCRKCNAANGSEDGDERRRCLARQRVARWRARNRRRPNPMGDG